MSKRMTDTGKWDKAWFMRLKPKHKCLWIYINDKCDQAGVWDENFTLATVHVGETLSEEDMTFFGDRVERISNEKWFIVGHVSFQVGVLSEASPAHKPIFRLLTKYNLLDRVFDRVSNTLQEKEKERDKEKDKDKEKERGSVRGAHLFRNDEHFDYDSFLLKFEKEQEAGIDVRYYYESVLDWSNGKAAKRVDWIAVARGFMRRDQQEGRLKKRPGTGDEPYMKWK